MKRVIAYIDGFNLYYGLREKGWRRLYWLNIELLVHNLLKQGQDLIVTKYFTARVIGAPNKEERQAQFLEALGTLPGVKIFYGNYQLNPHTCQACGYEDNIPKEKMTDVQIAVEMLSDAFNGLFDVALLMSADGDLTPAVRSIRQMFPDKRIVVVFPPARYSEDLASAANAHLHIGRRTLARSVFTDEIRKADGYILRRPSRWA